MTRRLPYKNILYWVIANPFELNKEEDMSPFSERVEWAFNGPCGASGRRHSSSERRRIRTAPPSTAHWASREPRRPLRDTLRTCSFEPQTTHQGRWTGLDTVLCTSDPYWTTVTTDRYLPDCAMQNALGCWCGVAQLPPLRPVFDLFHRYFRLLLWPVLLKQRVVSFW